MKSTILKYGLLSGGVMILIFSISFALMKPAPENYRIGEIIGYSTMILSMLVIYIACNEYRLQQPGQSVTFGQVFRLGIAISAIAGTMFGIFNWVYVEIFHPEFMEEYYSYFVESVKNSGASEAEIAETLKRLESEKEMFSSPAVQFFTMFITVFMIGAIVTLVTSFIQSKKAAPELAHS
ncbi:DUF4199 domain-containing protein [Pleionea sp. CnH1-48]|uniref:DUF4199 domain-containing protein n=1 Tax=Pleionea sp. CnH1-48 TaxID=2954494 RepID=UPI0020978806|nr:DUF4199 domain-containing protein [Pleionea sp. CnH1-48]MCO7225607.1 DUF4199 domain-containing protein [Pleionea sp. CnH1-48]